MTVRDDKYMLMLDDRVFYFGLLGQKMKTRRLGAASIYLSPNAGMRLQDENGRWSYEELALVAPYTSHQVVPDCGRIISVLIEPERLAPGQLEGLRRDIANPLTRAAMLRHFREIAPRLAEAARGSEIATPDFDRIVLGRPLLTRGIDRRIELVLNQLEGESYEGQPLAAAIAKRIGLSSSRFLHLFKEQTGISFRDYRGWRRARTFLSHANHNSSLTNVALSLGYPDSSHFSHSIRKTFGLKPRSIRIGSQDLRVDLSGRGAAALQLA